MPWRENLLFVLGIEPQFIVRDALNLRARATEAVLPVAKLSAKSYRKCNAEYIYIFFLEM
jgi:hypothetical protein